MSDLRPPSGRRHRQALCWGVLFFACLQLAVGLSAEIAPASVRDPEYAVKDGHELVYTPAIRSLDTFPMVFTASR